jgi:PAS domain S-box-containing protein
MEQASDGIFVIDSQGNHVDVNSMGCQMLGYERNELLQLNVSDVIAPEDLAATPLHLDELRAGKTIITERWLRRKDGSRFLVEVSAKMMPDGLLQGIVRDITERKQGEEERRRLSAAIEQTAESVLITDTKGFLVYVNPAFERVTGYSRAEAIGQTPRILNSGEQDGAFYQKLWDTITAGKVWQGRLVNKKKDGTLYTDEITITPVRDESGAIVNYVSVQRDVTHELELEEQYHQAQKMDAVGKLTGGIAHDFNNLLTAINGFAELMQHRLEPDDPLQNMVGNILHSGQRAADLTGQLLAFSRKQMIKPKILNLNTIVADMDKMLQRIIGEDIELKTIPSPDLWPVKVDPAQIEQIIVNLAVNARDAMPGGGQLTVETENVVLDEARIASHLETQPGEYVQLAVSDTGFGMNQEVQTRIFEPFFTTKETGKGTGLGLATVFGIVKQNSGDIWVYSEEGHGTVFKIFLPRAEEAIPAPPPYDPIGDLPRGTETILVVEDELAVRELAVQTLQAQGYTVLQAADGQEALDLIPAHNAKIHLVFTDVVMPQMDGKELANRFKGIHPNCKVLFSSGYTDDAIAHHGVLDPDVAFIQKPFSPTALTHKVREVLD